VRVEWRPLAEDDLAEIVRTIAADDPQAAYEVHDEIRYNMRKSPSLMFDLLLVAF
jgi:plasmid stabilization system protein ParE